MEKVCNFCGKPLTGISRVACNNACRCALYRARKQLKLAVYAKYLDLDLQRISEINKLLNNKADNNELPGITPSI